VTLSFAKVAAERLANVIELSAEPRTMLTEIVSE
jgi:hypothetical protein